MRAVPIINDPVYVATDYSWFDRQFLKVIKDKRDLPFVYLVIKISFVVFPIAVLLYTSVLPNWAWWLVAVAYQVINFYFRAPFGLMMHCISHRHLFKRQYKIFYRYIIWIMCPFMGHTPETYFSHHMGMHHAENNMPEDDSSTMMYQRDSFKEFLRYLGHFLVLGFKGLMDYLFTRKKKRLARNAMAGEFSFFAFCIIMCFVNLSGTMAVFIVTFFISRMIMMVGNWTQHAFIDPADPANPYKSCCTTINVNYNKRCWNDGYHSSHHARPALHWTEHPNYFKENLDAYSDNRAVVFDQLDFGGVFLCLMTKNYEKLARHFVNVNDTFHSDKEIIDMLKIRTQKFPEEILHTGNYQPA
jgi:fatty acid desaturase